jgi:quercetin dioxygenase-like cupin family protein
MYRVETETKIWGSAKHVFSDPHAAVSILETIKGGYCSRHFHSQRVNRFVVQSGVIEVVEYNQTGELETNRTKLESGDVHDVEAGVVHRFEVIEPGMVVEVYYPQRPTDRVNHDDIVRLDIGGRAIAA